LTFAAKFSHVYQKGASSRSPAFTAGQGISAKHTNAREGPMARDPIVSKIEKEKEIMATTIITPDQDAVVSEIHVAAPPDRVFQALVDPKQVMSWWTGGDCQIEHFSMETKRGGRWQYDTKQGNLNVNGVSKFHCEGEVVEYDPPRRLAYTWIANWHEDKTRTTTVRWDLTPQSGGTHVKVTHSGLHQEPAARKDYSNGWTGVVAQLKEFVEK
jgi:uncharacterized protein YndB with AHSA1/START domain